MGTDLLSRSTRSAGTPDVVDAATRREFLAVLTAAGLVAACGDEQSQQESARTRTVDHLAGTAIVPNRPQRVAILSVMDLDCAIALDAPVIAAPSWFPKHQYLEAIFADAGQLIDLGASETSLERLAGAEPDLILGEIWNEDIYGELSAIAPTVLIPEADWKQGLGLVGLAVGREPEAEQLLDAYQQRIDELRDALGPALVDTTVSVIRSRPDAIRFYGTAGFAGEIIADVGLPRPAAQRFDDIQQDFSVELLPEADADVVFVWSYSPEERDLQRELETDPLWAQLGAVRRQDVHYVGEHWYGAGPTAADLVLDDLSAISWRSDATRRLRRRRDRTLGACPTPRGARPQLPPHTHVPRWRRRRSP